MSNTSKRTTDMSVASPDAWLDELQKQIWVAATQNKDSLLGHNILDAHFAKLAAHLQEREAAAGFEGRIAELEWLNGLFDDELRDYVTKRLKALQVELLAVGEGRG